VAVKADNRPQIIFKRYWELVRPADVRAWRAILPEVPRVVALSAQAAA